MASKTSSTPTNVKAEAETSTMAEAVVVQEEKKMLVLKSKDNETFEVDIEVALMSETIKQMLEDVGVKQTIPLPNVDSKTLAKVIEYCKKHVHDNGKTSVSSELSTWDKDFVKAEFATLGYILEAAKYLNIRSLLDLGCQAVADIIEDLSHVEEIRETFNIENDFTPEEEADVRKENAWAFE